MRKILILACFVLVSIIGFSQGQRYVLVEHFTNSTSADVVSLNSNFYTNIYSDPNNALVMHHITYHIPIASDPNTSNCGLYLDAISDNAGMAGAYQVTSIPTAFLNGNEVPTSSDLVSQLQFDNQVFPPTSPLYFTDLGLVEDSPGNYTVFAFVKTEGNVPDGNYSIKIAITEKGVAYNGGNNEMFHRNVMRKMIPEPTGYLGSNFTPAPDGNIAVYPFSNVTLDSEWNIDSLCVLSWIIDDVTGNVINSGSSHDPQPLEISVDNNLTIQSVSCFDDCDGAIAIDVDGGTPPYSFTWIPNQGNNEDLVNLCAGVYSVTVTDVNGETSAANNINITNPQPLAITTEVLNDQDSYCLGFASVTLTGGTLPVTTFWKDSNGNLISTNQPNLTNVCAGFYQYTAIDNNGCILIDTITIFNTIGDLICEPNTLTDVTCNGFNNGALDLDVFNNQGYITYNWSGPLGFNSTAQDIVNLIGGSYTITGVDQIGQTCIETFLINDPAELSINPVVTDDFDAQCNGTALANPIGGNPPYTVEWDDGSIGVTYVNLCAGEYDVMVTDLNDCSTTTTFVIEPNSSLLTIDVIDTTNVSCNNFSDGEISFTIVGGTPNSEVGLSLYSVGWAILNSDGTTTPLPQYENLLAVNNLDSAEYQITVKDSGNVNTEVLTYEVINPEPLVLEVEVCLDGYDLGTAIATVTGGTPNYLFQWNTGDIGTEVNDLTFGLYNLVVFDDNACQVSNTNIFVSENDPICMVSNKDFAIANGIKVYPTNFTDNIKIEMASNNVNEFEFFLISGNGKMVKYEHIKNFNSTQTIQINADLPAGIYFASIHSKNGNATHQLIKL